MLIKRFSVLTQIIFMFVFILVLVELIPYSTTYKQLQYNSFI